MWPPPPPKRDDRTPVMGDAPADADVGSVCGHCGCSGRYICGSERTEPTTSALVVPTPSPVDGDTPTDGDGDEQALDARLLSLALVLLQSASPPPCESRARGVADVELRTHGDEADCPDAADVGSSGDAHCDSACRSRMAAKAASGSGVSVRTAAATWTVELSAGAAEGSGLVLAAVTIGSDSVGGGGAAAAGGVGGGPSLLS